MIPAILLSFATVFADPETPGAPADRPVATSPYAGWEHGPPAGPEFFPIAVWLQNPRNAGRYQQAGINLYVGLWKGPTEEQLAALRTAGMPVICVQNAVGLAHTDDPVIVGWMHGDEPDNARTVFDPRTGRRTYGPPIPPARVVAEYGRMRAADPTRPVLLNLGQGVANDRWKGRGSGAKLDDYADYVRGADIVSFDVYPVAGLGRPDGAEFLWYVAKGVDRLVAWTGGRKVVWNCIECTHISDPRAKATPAQVKAEVWMALVRGSRGIIYFVHEFRRGFRARRRPRCSARAGARRSRAGGSRMSSPPTPFTCTRSGRRDGGGRLTDPEWTPHGPVHGRCSILEMDGESSRLDGAQRRRSGRASPPQPGPHRPGKSQAGAGP